MKIVLATTESNHRETFAAVTEKSKENANLKNELTNLKKMNETLIDQVFHLEKCFFNFHQNLNLGINTNYQFALIKR